MGSPDLLESPGLAAVRHRDGRIAAGEALRQRFRGQAWIGREAGHEDLDLGAHARFAAEAAQAREDLLLREGHEPPWDLLVVEAWDTAEFPMQPALSRRDVAGVAARDGADMDSRIGRIEASGRIAALHHLLEDALELGHDHRAAADRVDAAAWARGMNLEAGHGREEAADALVRIRHLHRGWLADDDRAGARKVGSHPRDHVHDAEAGRFLVIGEQDVDGALQRHALELRCHRQADRVEGLHVAGASPDEPRAVTPEREGIAGPWLASDGHDVGMAREHDAAVDHRPDGGVERRLVAGCVRCLDEGDVVASQILRHEADQVQVRAVADRVEADEPREEVQTCW